MLAGALLLPSLIWIVLDRAVWPWDPAWYGEQSINLWIQLRHSPLHWPGDMLRAFEIKAPGIAWLGQFFVPLGQALGSIGRGLLLSVLLCQLAALIWIWLFVRAWFPQRLPLAAFAVLAAASAPLFIAMSHLFFVEALQLMATSWLFWLAAAAPGMSRTRITAHLVAALSAAMLAKASSPLYFALPLGLILLSWARAGAWLSPGERKGPLLVYLGASATLCAACIGWYARNHHQLLAFVRSAAVGDLAQLYGHDRTLGSKLVFWLGSFRGSFFHPWTAAALGAIVAVGLVAGLASRASRQRPGDRNARSGFLAAACFLQVAGVLIAVTAARNEDQRYLLPLLPSVVGALVWAVAALRSRVAIALSAMVVLAQFAVAHGQALRLVRVEPAMTDWLHPYEPDPTRLDEIRRLAELASPTRREGPSWIIGVELPWLNATSMAFVTVQQEMRTHRAPLFAPLGYAPTDFAATWRQLEAAHPQYFVSLDPAHMPPADAFNLMAQPVLQRLSSDACFEPLDFPSQAGLVIYRQTCAWQ